MIFRFESHRIRLKPRILVSPNTNEERIRQLVELAHNECYIANSLKCQVSVVADH